jgi:pimeloyl-ACP methyl ester carboxylesterase
MHRLQQYSSKVAFLLAIGMLLCGSLQAQSGKTRRQTAKYCGYDAKTKLYYCDYNRGGSDPILFIHGLGGSSYSWRYMVPAFSTTHRVITIDLLGQGQSPKPHKKRYSIIHQGELIQQFIDEKHLNNLTLVGNSYGGALSLLLAINMCEEDHTDKCGPLTKLVLIDSAGYKDHLPLHLKILRTPFLGWWTVHVLPPKWQIWIVLHDSYAVPSRITQEQIDTYAAPIAAKNGRYALLHLAQQAIPKDIDWYIKQYPTINVETLILWGDEDHVLPALIGERLDDAIPKSYMEYIKSAGHIPQEEQPDQVICKIRSFLGPSIPCQQ